MILCGGRWGNELFFIPFAQSINSAIFSSLYCFHLFISYFFFLLIASLPQTHLFSFCLPLLVYPFLFFNLILPSFLSFFSFPAPLSISSIQFIVSSLGISSFILLLFVFKPSLTHPLYYQSLSPPSPSPRHHFFPFLLPS